MDINQIEIGKKMVKMNKLSSLFFEKVNKVEQKTQIANIKNTNYQHQKPTSGILKRGISVIVHFINIKKYSFMNNSANKSDVLNEMNKLTQN